MTISFLLDVFLLTDNVGFLLSDDKDIPPFLVGYVIPSSAYILMFILFQKQTYESSFRKSSNQPFLQNSQFIFSQKKNGSKNFQSFVKKIQGFLQKVLWRFLRRFLNKFVQGPHQEICYTGTGKKQQSIRDMFWIIQEQSFFPPILRKLNHCVQ